MQCFLWRQCAGAGRKEARIRRRPNLRQSECNSREPAFTPFRAYNRRWNLAEIKNQRGLIGFTVPSAVVALAEYYKYLLKRSIMKCNRTYFALLENLKP